MPQRDAFLATILDRPDDDGPRLVFADWLEEQGECELAEFIRVQCELARGALAPARRDRLAEREAELLERHRREWLAPLMARLDEERKGQPPPSALPVHQMMQQLFGVSSPRRFEAAELSAPGPGRDWMAMLNVLFDPIQFRPPVEALFQCGFRRGFVERVELPAAEFARHADTLCSAVPLREVVATDGPFGVGFADLFRAPALARLAGLELQGPLTFDGLRNFLTCPYLTDLRRLSLERATVGRDDAPSLCAATHLPNLRELRLTGLPLGDEGVAVLANNAAWKTLEVLNLSQTGVGDAGVQTLARSPHFAQLRELNLGHNQITGAGVIALADSPCLPRLISVDLGHNQLAETILQSVNRFVARLMGDRTIAPWLERVLESPLAARLERLMLDRDSVDPADRLTLHERLGSRIRWA